MERLWVFLDEGSTIEAALQDLVVEQQTLGNLLLEHHIHETEIIVIVEDVQVLDDALVGDVATREADDLIEDGEGVAHAAVGLLRQRKS